MKRRPTDAIFNGGCVYRKMPMNSAAGTWFRFLMVRLPPASPVTAHFLIIKDR